MPTDPDPDDAPHIARARQVLAQTLPVIRDRDQALDQLYYFDPNLNEDVRRRVIASALWFLLTPEA